MSIGRRMIDKPTVVYSHNRDYDATVKGAPSDTRNN